MVRNLARRRGVVEEIPIGGAMPTYQYQCKNCGYELEELQSFNDAPLTLCPSCNTESLVRVLGTGAGLIFKGSGFYLTDYKKNGSSSASSTSKPSGTAATPPAASTSSTDSTPSKPDSSPKKD
jgi:putative FmdB family regulatory protein